MQSGSYLTLEMTNPRNHLNKHISKQTNISTSAQLYKQTTKHLHWYTLSCSIVAIHEGAIAQGLHLIWHRIAKKKMAIFQVTPLSNNFDEIKAELESLKDSEREVDFYELQNSAGFLISDSGTTEEVSIKIGIIDPETNERRLGSALVVRVPGYYGIGQTLMWEWLKSRLEKS